MSGMVDRVRAVIGALLFATGVLVLIAGAIYDLLTGDGTLAFLAGLVVAAAGLTVWRGPDWTDY